MLRHIDVRNSRSFSKFIESSRRSTSPHVAKTVAEIIRRVASDGDSALRLYTKKFDGAAVQSFLVSQKEINAAGKMADPEFVNILRAAANNIRRFHERQKRAPWRIQERYNSNLRQRYLPVDRTGVYVPGGRAAYPSTVLMNVIPAQVAGVKEIVLVSPPDRNGKVHPDVLTAAWILGVKTIFRVGGAQAIAALALGTKSIPAVDVIVGPGNIFVATAKRMLFGKVGIDGFAGPSEVVILADKSARAEFIASDMLAQAEHDESASSILVTDSKELADRVKQVIKDFLGVLSRKAIITASFKTKGAILLVKNMRAGVKIVNHLAPEHLEIMTRNPEAALRQIRNAGSIFLGDYSPAVVGDYFAGPNHVLPTDRTARFASPLSVDNFMKVSSVVSFSRAKMESVSEAVAMFANHEGLTAHVLSARLRGRKGKH